MLAPADPKKIKAWAGAKPATGREPLYSVHVDGKILRKGLKMNEATRFAQEYSRQHGGVPVEIYNSKDVMVSQVEELSGISLA